MNWRTIGNYEVSDTGEVRRDGRTLCTPPNSSGYPTVTVSLGKRGAVKQRTVHSLVAEAFLGPRPPGLVVNHRDGVKTHNAVDNLEYVTQAENEAHAVRHGLKARGAKNSNTKLTPEQVINLRTVMALSHNKSALAREYGVSRRALRFIEMGRNHAPLEQAVLRGRL